MEFIPHIEQFSDNMPWMLAASMGSLLIVILINWIPGFLKSTMKKQLLKDYESTELKLFRFPTDINDIREFSKSHRNEALAALELQKEMLILTEQMIDTLPFLHKDSRGHKHLSKLLFNAKQCVKNLDNEIGVKSK